MSPHWEDTSIPIPYVIDIRGCDDIIEGREITEVQSAFQTWEDVASGGIQFQFSGLVERDSARGNDNIIMWMEEDWPFEPDYVAVTRIYYNRYSGKLLKAEMMLNGRDFTWSVDGKRGTLDVRNVATHEIGHFIGIRDTQSPPHTMFEYITRGETEKRSLSDADIERLKDRYPFINPEGSLVLRFFLLNYEESVIIPSKRRDGIIETCDYLNICRLGSPGEEQLLGVIQVDGGNCDLLAIDRNGDLVNRFSLIEGDPAAAARIRASSTVDLNGDGALFEAALLFSSPDGVYARLFFIPPNSPGESQLRSITMKAAGAEDVIAFTAFPPGRRIESNPLIAIEKLHNSEFNLTLFQAFIRNTEPGQEIVLERDSSSKIPNCVSVIGLTGFTTTEGQAVIAVLLRSEMGMEELALYAAPFKTPSGSERGLRPVKIFDATTIKSSGIPLSIAGLDPNQLAVVYSVR